MKLFHRSVKNETEDELLFSKDGNVNEMQIDEIMKFFAKNTSENDNLQEDNEPSDLKNSVSNKIKVIREEYDNAIDELLPVKWELIEKKLEMDKMRSEYNTLLLELKHAKDELYSIKSEMSDIKLQIDVKKNELLKIQSKITHDCST